MFEAEDATPMDQPCTIKYRITIKSKLTVDVDEHVWLRRVLLELGLDPPPGRNLPANQRVGSDMHRESFVVSQPSFA